MPAPIRTTQFGQYDRHSGLFQAVDGNTLHKATDYAQTSAAAVKQVLDRYPPVKAFTYAMAFTSALPVTVFAAVSGSAFLGGLATAGTGIAVFQGIVFAITGFILFWFLLGAFLISATIAFWFTLAFFGVQMAKAVSSRANEK
ncbi:hypothetical protein HDU78_000270 [Chytriomyces hyalinus]|nr:hypothetical protein HDU78_000270 [Chytriomyces hyalinus]KAJ3254857.1 hypothetical protein HDU77_003919 [Chytriomyces hyalinus]